MGHIDQWNRRESLERGPGDPNDFKKCAKATHWGWNNWTQIGQTNKPQCNFHTLLKIN